MKRRQALRSLISLPAIGALPGLAQQAPTDKSKPAGTEKLPAELKPAQVEEFPKLALTAPDAAVDGTPRFFTPTQLATLRRLCDALVPALDGKPGALDAGVPEFLDFLIGDSPQDRQSVYRHGLDALESASQKQFHKPVRETSAAELGQLLAPLAAEWTFRGPADDLGRFLQTAKEDTLRATLSSREWAAAGTQRRASGLGTYWFQVE